MGFINLFPHIIQSQIPSVIPIFPFILTIRSWHFRLGHLSNARLGIPHSVDNSIAMPTFDHFSTFHVAKQRKLCFSISNLVSLHCFDLDHADMHLLFLYMTIDTFLHLWITRVISLGYF